MLTTPTIFKLAEALDRVGVKIRLSAGARVGRGFADIGYEEFSVLPGGEVEVDELGQRRQIALRVVSLLTGEVRTLNEHEIQKLFVIPSVDQILEMAFQLKLGDVTVSGGVLPGWEVGGISQKGSAEMITTLGASLEEALLKLLLAAVGGELPQAKPRELNTDRA